MDKVIKNKKGLELVTSRSSGYETSSEKFLYTLYYLTKFDDVMSSSFWVIAKIASANLYKSIHEKIMPLPFVLSNLESVERKGEN